MSTLAFIVYNTYTISIGPFNFINTIPSPVCNVPKNKRKHDSRSVPQAGDHGTLLCSSTRRDSENYLLVLTGLTINQADRPDTVTSLRLLGKH